MSAGNPARPERPDEAQGDAAARRRAKVLHGAICIVERLHRVFNQWQQRAAVGLQPDGPADTVEEQNSLTAFQLFDRAAQRRLCDAEFFSRTAQMAEPCGGPEIRKLHHFVLIAKVHEKFLQRH
jgi:hypothetical protein